MSLMVALKSRVLWGERCYGMLHYNFNSMEQGRRTSDNSFVCTGVYKSYWLASRCFSSGSLSQALRRSFFIYLALVLFFIYPFSSIIEILQYHHPVVVFPNIRNLKKEKIWKDWFLDEVRNQKGRKKMMRSCAFSDTHFYPPYRHDPVGCISCKRMNVVDCKEIVEPRVAGELKHENLVLNELMRVKLPRWRDNEAVVSSVRPSSSLAD
mgnify:CR=1 FL=1